VLTPWDARVVVLQIFATKDFVTVINWVSHYILFYRSFHVKMSYLICSMWTNTCAISYTIYYILLSIWFMSVLIIIFMLCIQICLWCFDDTVKEKDYRKSLFENINIWHIRSNWQRNSPNILKYFSVHNTFKFSW